MYARFWEKVEKTEDGCWLWMFSLNKKGYGKYSIKNGWMFAHRFVWEITYGPIPDGMFVLHECDTPACCRPDHLFLGTHQDNMTDRAAKGRGLGEKNQNTKLTDAQVATIRQEGRYTSYAKIGARYGVDGAHICLILQGKSR